MIDIATPVHYMAQTLSVSYVEYSSYITPILNSSNVLLLGYSFANDKVIRCLSLDNSQLSVYTVL